MSSPQMNDRLFRIRHSLAHVLAQAVMELRPGAKLGFGPPIDDGFYYDFILPAPLKEEDFPAIEKRMKEIIRSGVDFVREELPREQALRRIDEMGEPYKREFAEELLGKGRRDRQDEGGLDRLSFYRSGSFIDMCDGPHVRNSREIPLDAFKLRSLAGAYWRGDSKNVMMTRIYAWAFESREELETRIEAHRAAIERDHKKLGAELDFFVIDEEIGKGLPLWLPNGTVIRDELEKLMRELEFKARFQRVSTPHLAKEELYFRTGHLPYYAEGMYPRMEVREAGEDGNEEIREVYRLRPMNCPHHHRVFASRKRSYRDLPLRLAEYGQVYRFEGSGALSGLLRVRGMCQNDAHIYCTREQIRSEFLDVIRMHLEVYKILGITNYSMRLSTWDPEDPRGKEKFVDDPAAWEFSQNEIREAMREAGLEIFEGKGEAAFYGPKIDFQLRTVTGREETASTAQLDFAVPPRLALSYIGADNQEHVPYVIHRAPLGTHERFAAFLIEQYGGAFPTWLAPVQVRVVPVSERFNEYAERLVAELRDDFVRAEADLGSDTMGKKIRKAAHEKIPNVLVVGEREQADSSVTLRRHGQKEPHSMSFESFRGRILEEIRSRALSRAR